MAFIGSLFSDSKGAGFQGSGTNIQQPVSTDQAQQAYGQTQSGLNSQQAFMQALQGQNAVQNQLSAYNQLQGVANGTGPNPAQAQLAQATGANVANQAAMAAGQRGANANVGLMARQAAQQGANTQQQAAGQAATMQSNQQLNALGQMQGAANNMVQNQAGAISGYNQAAQSEQQNLLNSIQGVNNSNVAMQSNQNNANANIAAGNAANQAKMFNGVTNVGGGMLNLAHGGQATAQPVQNFDGGGLASLIPLVAMLADGGQVSSPPKYADGGPTSAVGRYLFGSTPGNSSGFDNSTNTQSGAMPLQRGQVADDSKKQSAPKAPQQPMTTGFDMPGGTTGGLAGAGDDVGLDSLGTGAVAGDAAGASGGLGAMAMFASKGGKMPGKVSAMVSPGEKLLSPKESQEVAAGQKKLSQAGKKVGGEAKVKGDSLKNDVVPADLPDGSFVIPRSIMQSKNPDKNAADFVRAHMSRSEIMKRK